MSSARNRIETVFAFNERVAEEERAMKKCVPSCRGWDSVIIGIKNGRNAKNPAMNSVPMQRFGSSVEPSEGAQVVTTLHAFLAATDREPPAVASH
jgi:hypothetical protein